MRPLPHILIAVGGATLAGAAWAGIAGFLKATVGAHEVISTIMLNWIAIWVGIWLFGDGGPLQNAANKSVPISNDVAASAQLPVFWGVQGLQGLDVALLRRDRGARRLLAGPQPDDARLRGARGRLQPGGGGLRRDQREEEPDPRDGDLRRVRRPRRRARHARLPLPLRTSDIPVSSVGFLGIAVALLGRNTAVGVGIGALLFGALLFGTTHGLSSNVIDPSLAGNLTYMIQGLVVLFVGADVLILYVWNTRRKLRPQAKRRRGARHDLGRQGSSRNPVSAGCGTPPSPGTPASRSASSRRSSGSRRSRRAP